MAADDELGSGGAKERPHRGRRRAASWLALTGVLGLVLMGRVVLDGRAELRRAENAADVDTQILFLGRAARWRMPLFSHDDDALDRLEAIGEDARGSGSEGAVVALAAFREVRRSLIGTRAWWVPEPHRLERANAAIAELMAAQDVDAGRARNLEERAAEYASELAVVPGPNPALGKLAALAFLGWIGSVLGFVMHGLDEEGRLRRRLAVRWGLAFLLSLLAWALLMRFS